MPTPRSALATLAVKEDHHSRQLNNPQAWVETPDLGTGTETAAEGQATLPGIVVIAMWCSYRPFLYSGQVLHLIPAGTSKQKATRLLESPRLAEGFYLLAEEYDAILIDSPSFVDHPETESLLRRVGGCVFVAEASSVRVPAAQTVVGHIRKSGVEDARRGAQQARLTHPQLFLPG